MKLLLALLAAILIKSLIWTFVVPVFQTPDEQAHFAQLSYMAENKTLNVPGGNNLSLEIATIEEILGTRRNGQGNNKFTYHPEYKNTSPIPIMPISSRTTYVDYEAAGYPPLYYLLSVPFYNAVYDHNLADRVMFSRTMAVICNLLLVICAYFIGRIIWKEKVLALVLAGLVGFQPMISYVAAGIHPDNLLNLLTSLLILVCLLILKNGLKIKYLIALGILIFLGFQTKILIVFSLPVIAAVIVYKFSPFLSLLCLIAPVVAFILQIPIPYMPGVTSASPLVNMNFLEYLKFRGPKMAFEIWPWYWGVFKWLGVTLPPLVMKIITRVSAISVLGLFIWVIRLIRNKKMEFIDKAMIFFLVSTATYAFYLILWDWRLMQSIGYSQGLQGRYFFTNIVPQMALLLLGITIWRRSLALIFLLGMIILNGIALQTIINSFY